MYREYFFEPDSMSFFNFRCVALFCVLFNIELNDAVSDTTKDQ